MKYAIPLILAVTAARLWWLTTAAAPPLHFDEAQYWSYGEALDWGYYSKPPLIAWLIRASTEIFGDSAFGARFFAPVLHGVVALLIYGIAARLFKDERGGRIGVWAVALYLFLPGVTASSGAISTDPAMMACWAGALYAVVRAESSGGAGWAAVAGALIGLGLLAKYTMIALPLSLLGYGLFSARLAWGRIALGIGAALVVVGPNLWWNARHDFATIAHVGDNANLGGALFNPDKLAEFLGAQLAIFTPVLAAALIWLLWRRREWRGDRRFHLLLWVTLPLLLAMTAQAFISRAHPNWAAPAYIGGTLAVATWLCGSPWDRWRDAAGGEVFIEGRLRRGWLAAALALGIAAWIGLWGAAAVYAGDRSDLPRLYDPFKKHRLYPELCRRALPLMRAHEADALLSPDRRLLAVCMFEGGIGMDRIALFNPDRTATNHYALVAGLTAPDPRRFIAINGDPSGFGLDGQLLETGEIRTHAGDGKALRPYAIWLIEGVAR